MRRRVLPFDEPAGVGDLYAVAIDFDLHAGAGQVVAVGEGVVQRFAHGFGGQLGNFFARAAATDDEAAAGVHENVVLGFAHQRKECAVFLAHVQHFGAGVVGEDAHFEADTARGAEQHFGGVGEFAVANQCQTAQGVFCSGI